MSPEESACERRAHPRAGVNFVIRFRRWENFGDSSWPSRHIEIVGTDLSLGGAGAVGSRELLETGRLSPGEKLMLEIELDEKSPSFFAAAELRWHRRREGEAELHFAGFKFFYLAPEAKEKLEALIQASPSVVFREK